MTTGRIHSARTPAPGTITFEVRSDSGLHTFTCPLDQMPEMSRGRSAFDYPGLAVQIEHEGADVVRVDKAPPQPHRESP